MPITENAPLVVRSDTRVVSIEARPEDVYAFVADPENLPTWAVGFCRAIRREAGTDRWIVTTAEGEMPIRYMTHEAAHAIDFHFTPAPGVEVAAFRAWSRTGMAASTSSRSFSRPACRTTCSRRRLVL